MLYWGASPLFSMTYYYTYYSYEEWGRGYIGRRTCECLPENDNYFGSYHDKTFHPTQKIILGIYPSYKDSIDAEIILHDFYEVDTNSHFANKAKQKSSGFSYRGSGENNPNYGKKHSEDTKNKISQSQMGNTKWVGRMHSEETKKRLRKVSTERNNKPEIRKKIKEARAKQKWWNNGEISKLSIECPGEEWSLGSMTEIYGRKRDRERRQRRELLNK